MDIVILEFALTKGHPLATINESKQTQMTNGSDSLALSYTLPHTTSCCLTIFMLWSRQIVADEDENQQNSMAPSIFFFFGKALIDIHHSTRL